MATLYRYIARKEDVLYLISQAAMDDVWGGLQVLNPQGSARERLEQAARHFFQAVSRRRREFKLLYRESASLGEDHLRLIEGTELQERDYFAAIIADGIRSGEFAEVDVPVIAHDIIMLAHMWALKGWALRGDKDLDAYMETQLRVIFCALEPQRVDAEPKL
jgi:AcrR family transcriptional regulator